MPSHPVVSDDVEFAATEQTEAMSATLSEPFSAPEFVHQQIDDNSDDESDDEDQKPRTLHRTSTLSQPPQDLRGDSIVQTTDPANRSSTNPTTPSQSPAQPRVRKRYYAHALSEADKASLRDPQGGREWTLKDVVDYQRSRTELVPLGPYRGQQMEAVLKDWRTADKKLRESETVGQRRNAMASKSMHNLHSGTAPIGTPTPPRTSSSQTTLVSSTCDGSSSRVRSPLMQDPLVHTCKPDVTFDSMLVGPKSGSKHALVLPNSKNALVEGETPRRRLSGMSSAEMFNKTRRRMSTGNMLGDAEVSHDTVNKPAEGEKTTRRLSRMPSYNVLSTLRRQKSARQQNRED
ncbi:hypothetical protein P280DRAFT_508499 [Massarina eburnea CBS 473.64]|uniref:Uncharacterized protein n=1 Tax=Massarina eburnea CBS 473.64 TaxID=1395130 RepID=A0A6A6RXD5_9PLEO|nr:hypothetical protein P280DRAFT_508499 [Massarina eburnea CBS 473.64]